MHIVTCIRLYYTIPDILEIDSRDRDFDFFQTELLGLIQNVTIESNHRSAIEVNSRTIATAKIVEHVTASRFETCRFYQIDRYVSFAQFELRSAA